MNGLQHIKSLERYLNMLDFRGIILHWTVRRTQQQRETLAFNPRRLLNTREHIRLYGEEMTAKEKRKRVYDRLYMMIYRETRREKL